MDILTSEIDLEAVNQNRANPYFQGGMPALSAMEGDRGDRATGAIAGPPPASCRWFRRSAGQRPSRRMCCQR